MKSNKYGNGVSERRVQFGEIVQRIMYKITITIPIYNAEKYLKNLLESILTQTLDYNEIQVIMVDDH